MYELVGDGSMCFNGVEFFDRTGRSMIRVSRTEGQRKVIRLEKNEKVVGLNALTDGMRLYDVKFKIAKVV